MSDCANILPKRRAPASQFCKGLIPNGDLDCSNINFTLDSEAEPDTLEVILDGNILTRGLDFTVGADNKSFSLIIQPDSSNRLNSPPGSTEELRVNYIAASSGCAVIL